jgi:hypothetical protein
MTRRATPEAHWRSYGTEPLPTAAAALDEPLAAFPSRFLRITCDRCGKDRMLNEAHAPDRQRDMPLRVLLARMRHDRCGGRAGKAELLTGCFRGVRRQSASAVDSARTRCPAGNACVLAPLTDAQRSSGVSPRSSPVRLRPQFMTKPIPAAPHKPATMSHPHQAMLSLAPLGTACAASARPPASQQPFGPASSRSHVPRDGRGAWPR